MHSLKDAELPVIQTIAPVSTRPNTTRIQKILPSMATIPFVCEGIYPDRSIHQVAGIHLGRREKLWSDASFINALNEAADVAAEHLAVDIIDHRDLSLAADMTVTTSIRSTPSPGTARPRGRCRWGCCCSSSKRLEGEDRTELGAGVVPIRSRSPVEERELPGGDQGERLGVIDRFL